VVDWIVYVYNEVMNTHNIFVGSGDIKIGGSLAPFPQIFTNFFI